MVFNFLALPRELRDLIYAYVVEDVRYRHAFVTDETYSTPKYGNIVRVTLENAPSINLLLSQSQMCDEYKHATRNLQRSARIRLDTLMGLPPLRGLEYKVIEEHIRPYKATTLTVVIDDWSRGMDLSFSFHDARERFWDHLGMIAYYWKSYESLRSIVIAKIIFKEKDCPSGESGSPEFTECVSPPRGPFLSWPYRGWHRLLEEDDTYKSEFFLLKECKQASRAVLAPCGRRTALSRVACLVYTTGPGNPQASWDIDEVNELWPRTNSQPDLWTWHDIEKKEVGAE